MDLGLEGKRAIVTGGSLGIGKAIARELAREGVDVVIVARTKDTLEAAARELAAETGRRVIPLVADVTSKAQVDAMVAAGRRPARRAAHPGEQRLAAGRLRHRHRSHRDRRGRGPAARLQREVRGRAALRPRRHPVSEGAGLGPHHQHQRDQCAERGQPERRGAQYLPRPPQQDAGRAARALRHHGQLRAPRHHAHRAHPAPARGPGQGAGHRRGRGCREGATSRPTPRAATRSAAWWTRRRSPTSPRSWPRTRPGRSRASSSWRPAAPAGRCTTEAAAMITRFSTLYVGHIELERCGLAGTPADDRRYSNERLIETFDTATALARAADTLGYETLWLAEHHFQHEGYECIPNIPHAGRRPGPSHRARQDRLRLQRRAHLASAPARRGLRHRGHPDQGPRRVRRGARVPHPRGGDLRQPDAGRRGQSRALRGAGGDHPEGVPRGVVLAPGQALHAFPRRCPTGATR